MTIYLLNISRSSTTSGVDRYLDRLTYGFSQYGQYNFVVLKLLITEERLWNVRKQTDRCYEVVIPIANEFSKYINSVDFRRLYNQKIKELLFSKFQFPLPDIIHVHTTNLIDLAILLKKQCYRCSIISHLHCIPWKNLISHKTEHFNYLYERYNTLNKIPIQDRKYIFTRGGTEWRFYTHSDNIICVTHCGKDYLVNLGIDKNKVDVIYNGDIDVNVITRKSIQKNNVKLLYVGLLTPAKGVQFLLEAMHFYPNKENVTLTLCGYASSKLKASLQSLCKEGININFMGNVGVSQLYNLYQSHDIGIITSLNEQCSYVAIEMMKFGVPIITTVVDGLGEMFIDRYNCIAIPTYYTKNSGLYIDSRQITSSIIELTENDNLRNTISFNSRHSFEKCFSIHRMIEETRQHYEYVYRKWM